MWVTGRPNGPRDKPPPQAAAPFRWGCGAVGRAQRSRASAHGVGFMAQLGAGDGRVAPNRSRCAMLARPVKRAASAASVSPNRLFSGLAVLVPGHL